MNDYMAQKADDQIEAGLHERDELIAQIEELTARCTQLKIAVDKASEIIKERDRYKFALEKICGRSLEAVNPRKIAEEALIKHP